MSIVFSRTISLHIPTPPPFRSPQACTCTVYRVIDPADTIHAHISKVSTGFYRYCPAKWIRLKVCSFLRPLLKWEVQRFIEKSVRSPSCESLLKIPRHLVQLLAIGILIPNCAHRSASGLFFPSYSYWPISLMHILLVFYICHPFVYI